MLTAHNLQMIVATSTRTKGQANLSLVLVISGCIGRGVVSPLLGNQHLEQGGVLSTSVRQIAISVISSVSPGFSAAAISGGGCVSGGLVSKTKTALLSFSAFFAEGKRGRLHTLT